MSPFLFSVDMNEVMKEVKAWIISAVTHTYTGEVRKGVAGYIQCLKTLGVECCWI